MNRVTLSLSKSLVALSLLLTCTVAARAADVTWQADPIHSTATFTATHLGISHVTGIIPIESASLEIPEGSNIPSSATAALDPTGIDTRFGMRDNDLKSAHFFDIATYPAMGFKSTKIVPTDATHFTMTGDLTMHGQTHPVTLTCEYLGRMTDSRGHQHIGYTGKATIDRTQWGMTYGAIVASNSIDLEIDIEAIAKTQDRE
ncbi:MAG TPA: YceI family protein [Candidatus Baltobacteraceae bacterium]|nr:YceI family protein [Candidatus Baltobacteraceae bacterium]